MEEILGMIRRLESKRHEMNLSRESTIFISEFCRKRKIKNFLEIGAFNGYSALNFSLACEKVVSLEIDESNYKMANDNVKGANCENVEIIKGDAIETLKLLKDKFDVIFIDGRKSEYKDYLILSLKLLKSNGVIFVDNTLSHKNNLKEFFDYLNKSKLYFKELNLGKGLMVISKNKIIF